MSILFFFVAIQLLIVSSVRVYVRNGGRTLAGHRYVEVRLSQQVVCSPDFRREIQHDEESGKLFIYSPIVIERKFYEDDCPQESLHFDRFVVCASRVGTSDRWSI